MLSSGDATLVQEDFKQDYIKAQHKRLIEANRSPFSSLSADSSKAAHPSVTGAHVVNIPPHPANIDGLTASMLSGVPPPYQPVSVRHLESQSSSEEPQDYLWLANCESKKPVPNR